MTNANNWSSIKLEIETPVNEDFEFPRVVIGDALDKDEKENRSLTEPFMWRKLGKNKWNALYFAKNCDKVALVFAIANGKKMYIDIISPDAYYLIGMVRRMVAKYCTKYKKMKSDEKGTIKASIRLLQHAEVMSNFSSDAVRWTTLEMVNGFIAVLVRIINTISKDRELEGTYGMYYKRLKLGAGIIDEEKKKDMFNLFKGGESRIGAIKKVPDPWSDIENLYRRYEEKNRQDYWDNLNKK